MATIDAQALGAGNERQTYFEEGFRDTIEAHLPALRLSKGTSLQPISAVLADVWQADLYGFLASMSIPIEVHWVIMRMNNLFSPHDFGPQTTHLLVPNEGDVAKILTAYRARKNLEM